MESYGIVFDIAEASIHDGPGLRITVFLKGCCLRCRWCHSPEGQSFVPEWLELNGMRRLAGERWSASALADYLRGNALFFSGSGGVTFSGGEPLSQADFVLAVMEKIPEIHQVIDTSACGDGGKLCRLAEKAQLMHWGVKILSSDAEAERWTGLGMTDIVENIRRADGCCATPSVFRIPLLAGVTDTPENLAAVAKLARGLRNLKRIEFLSANQAAGAKYRACGRIYAPGFDEKAVSELDADALAEAAGVPVAVLDRRHLSGEARPEK